MPGVAKLDPDEVPRRDQGHQHRRAVERRPLSLRRGRRPGRRRRDRHARGQGHQDHPRRQGSVAHLHEPRRQVRASPPNNGDETISIIDLKANKVAATLEAGPDMTGVNFAGRQGVRHQLDERLRLRLRHEQPEAGRPHQDRHEHPARNGDDGHRRTRSSTWPSRPTNAVVIIDAKTQRDRAGDERRALPMGHAHHGQQGQLLPLIDV